VVRDDTNLAVEGEDQLVTARIDGQLFGFSILKVQDIVEPKLLTAVPLAPSAIAAVMNLRGRIVTVIDLRKCLGKLEEVHIDRHMGITVENRGDLYTLLVDEIGDVCSVASKDYEPAPATLDENLKPLCSGVYRLEDELLVVLDVDRILDPETIARTPPSKFRRRRRLKAIDGGKKEKPTAASTSPSEEGPTATEKQRNGAAVSDDRAPVAEKNASAEIPSHAIERKTEAVSTLMEDAAPFEDKDLGCTIDIDAGGKEYLKPEPTVPEPTAPEPTAPKPTAPKPVDVAPAATAGTGSVAPGVGAADRVVKLDFLDPPMSEEDAAAHQREAAEKDLADAEQVEAAIAEEQLAVADNDEVARPSSPAAPQVDPSAPLFDRVGGATVVAKAVEALYDKLLNDNQLAGFYVALDLGRQLDVTNNFITVTLGGPDRGNASGVSVQQALMGEPEDPTDDHFDSWLGYLEIAFREAGAPDELIFEALAMIERHRAEALAS